jgi:hypothetical protein
MKSESLHPGDHVVPLAALSIQCATFASASSLGGVLFRGNASGVWIMSGILIGAVVGFATGWLFGRVFYPAARDNVLVVRVGRSALTKTLPAAFAPSAIGSLAVAIVAAATLGAPTIAVAVIVAAITSTSVACIFGFGSALA